MTIRIYSRGGGGFTLIIGIYLRGVHPDLLKRGHPDINNRYILKGVQSIKGLYLKGVHPDLLKEGVSPCCTYLGKSTNFDIGGIAQVVELLV